MHPHTDEYYYTESVHIIWAFSLCKVRKFCQGYPIGYVMSLNVGPITFVFSSHFISVPQQECSISSGKLFFLNLLLYYFGFWYVVYSFVHSLKT